jgi:hypothetical protein
MTYDDWFAAVLHMTDVEASIRFDVNRLGFTNPVATFSSTACHGCPCAGDIGVIVEPLLGGGLGCSRWGGGFDVGVEPAGLFPEHVFEAFFGFVAVGF